MTHEWTVERAGTTYGPVPWEQVAQWAREGLVGPTDLLRRAGDPVAYRASDVPGLLTGHATAASPAVGAATSATQVPWIAVTVAVSVATLGIVLGVRAIGSSDDAPAVTSGPTVATSTAHPPTESVPVDPGVTTSTDDTGTAPRDPAAYLGLWDGAYQPEPSGDWHDGNFWAYYFHHLIRFEVATVEGSDGPELRVWGEAVLPPSMMYEPFEGAVPMIRPDGSLSFTIVWTSGTGPGNGAVLHFTGQRSGSQIKGTILGERMSNGSTVEGTFTVNGAAES
ncbi:MAG: hypothetical protein ABIJ48_01940 [Actinomycetota bacterium]